MLSDDTLQRLHVSCRQVAAGQPEQMLVIETDDRDALAGHVSVSGSDVAVVHHRATSRSDRDRFTGDLIDQVCDIAGPSSSQRHLLEHVDSCHPTGGGVSFREPNGPVAAVAVFVSSADLLPDSTLEHLLKMQKIAGVMALPLLIAGSCPDAARFASRCYRIDEDSCMMLRSVREPALVR
jgi:hypothetical protein